MSDAAGGDTPNTETKPLTADAVSEMINKAITGREKRQAEGIAKMLDERFAKFAESLPKPAEPPLPEGDGKKVDPEVVKQRQAIAALEKRLADAEKARTEAETRSRKEKATNLLTAALGKHVMPETVGVLTRAMIGDIVFDDAGEPMMPLPDGSGTSTIDAVVSEWAKSDSAKAFRPAPTSGGSGARSTKTQATTIAPGTKVEHLTDAQRDALVPG